MPMSQPVLPIHVFSKKQKTEERQPPNVLGVISFRACDWVQTAGVTPVISSWNCGPSPLKTKPERLCVCARMCARTHGGTHDQIMENICISTVIHISNFYCFPGLTQNPDDSLRSRLHSLIQPKPPAEVIRACVPAMVQTDSWSSLIL